MLNVNAHCVIFGVNPSLNKRCVLSTEKNDLKFPYLVLNENYIDDIAENIIQFLKQYIFVNDLVLIPQLVTINSKPLNSEPKTLDTVFAFIVDYNSSIDTSKVCWLDFNPLIEHKFSPTIFEAMQKLS